MSPVGFPASPDPSEPRAVAAWACHHDFGQAQGSGWDDLWELVAMARTAEGRHSQPSASVIDSQSVKTTESGGVRGYDAGKRIKGRKQIDSF